MSGAGVDGIVDGRLRLDPASGAMQPAPAGRWSLDAPGTTTAYADGPHSLRIAT